MVAEFHLAAFASACQDMSECPVGKSSDSSWQKTLESFLSPHMSAKTNSRPRRPKLKICRVDSGWKKVTESHLVAVCVPGSCYWMEYSGIPVKTSHECKLMFDLETGNFYQYLVVLKKNTYIHIYFFYFLEFQRQILPFSSFNSFVMIFFQP